MTRIRIPAVPGRIGEGLPLARRRRLGGNLLRAAKPETSVSVPPPWWANPTLMMLGFLIPVYTLVYSIPALFGTQALQLRSPIFFEPRYFGLGLAFLVCGMAGCLVGQLIQPSVKRTGGNNEEYVSALFLEVLALVTIGAYLIWFRAIFFNPAAMMSVIRGDGEFGNIRWTSRTIGGVTTLAQCGIAFTILYLDRVWGQRKPLPEKRIAWYFGAILGLGLFRAYAWAERLALIELLVPIGLMFFCYRDRGTNPVLRLFRGAGPAFGVVGLIGFFGLMEYFRSWSAYYVHLEAGFWSFVMRRFLAYYYGALNNGAGLLMIMDWPTYDMQHVLYWLYRFPGSVGPILQYAFEMENLDWKFLTRYADPEFNNMSGIFIVFYDMGVPAALIYASAAGCLAGASYASMCARRGMLRLLYPLFFLSILEVMRVSYFGDPRAFPPVLALVGGYALFRTRVVAPVRQHQVSRARRHSAVEGGRWFRSGIGRFFGR